ncbi:MAG: hypothetical protein ACLPX1_15250 [Steroidobacteraceae bacterium]
MSLERITLIIAAATMASGCHMFSKSVPDCHRPQEYQSAVQVAPLKVPAGLDTPNTQGALVIPALDVTPPPPARNAACLDAPPRYIPAPANKAASG